MQCFVFVYSVNTGFTFSRFPEFPVYIRFPSRFPLLHVLSKAEKQDILYLHEIKTLWGLKEINGAYYAPVHIFIRQIM